MINMKFNSMFFMSLLSLMFLTACTVRFPQIEHFSQSIKKTSSQTNQFNWQLTSGFYKAEMIAVSANSGVVFASLQDDGMFFNGQYIERVIKIGADASLYEIIDDLKENGLTERRYLKNKKLQAKHTCFGWQFTDEVATQKCVSHSPRFEYVNTKKHHKEFGLTFIDQVISATLDRVILEDSKVQN